MKIILLLLYINQVFGMSDNLKDLLTPHKDEGEFCGYESCPQIEGHLNVHIVPHTHGEVGHYRTFDQHYTGDDNFYAKSEINMKRTLDSVITELWSHKNRKFTLSDIAYLFKWWNNRDETVHRMVYELLRQGRLFLVGGGWTISDEASASYHAIIDHFTYSLRKINSTFLECGRPLVSWQAESFGHSKEFALLMSMMGFDGHFISPISYDDEILRMTNQDLEFIWKGNDYLGPETEIFTHKLFDGYWSPPGFCFGGQCSDPLINESPLNRNVKERAEEFIKSMKFRQAPHYKTNHIMVIMGMRYGYYDAPRWFQNIDKLIYYVNQLSYHKKENITLYYSTPACYLKSVYKENPRLSIMNDDIMPVAYNKNTYFSGLFTSRPTLKRIVREGHSLLQVIKQLQVLSNLKNDHKLLEEFHWIMGILQDHNVLSGGLRPYVKDYYMEKIKNIMEKSLSFISQAINKLRNSDNKVKYTRCNFNISHCPETNRDNFYIVIYNPLAWSVTVPVRLPVQKAQYIVTLPNMTTTNSVLIKKPDFIYNLQPNFDKTDHELLFIAELPPIGYKSYYIQKINRKKRSNRIITNYVKKVFSRKNREFNFDGSQDYEDYDDLIDFKQKPPQFLENFLATDFIENGPVSERNDFTVTRTTEARFDEFYSDDDVRVTTSKMVQPLRTDMPLKVTSEITEAIREDMTTPEVTTEAMTTLEVTTEAMTTPKVTTESTTTPEVTTENMTMPEDVPREFMVTPEVTTKRITMPEDENRKFMSMPEMTTETTSTEALTTQKIMTWEAVTTPEIINILEFVTAETMTTPEVTKDSMTTPAMTKEETTKFMTTTEITPQRTIPIQEITAPKYIDIFSTERIPIKNTIVENFQTPNIKAEKSEIVTQDDYLYDTEGTTEKMKVLKSTMYRSSNDLFISNQYIKIQLNKNREIQSIVLSNGVAVDLNIDFFYYVSDDPMKLGKVQDIQPGAYVFRPIDPYPVLTKHKYKANVIKTDLVEELIVNYGKFIKFSIRIYKDSPTIEIDWVIQSIFTDEAVPLGKEIFVRYKTNLAHEDIFYTDANGRQTMRRKYGEKPYDSTNPNYIPNNYYPVTSRIHIDDRNKNIRFTIFNDRAQGATAKNGAIDFLIQRRILTDDAGFQATLNETEQSRGITVRGKHYLYITKSNNNKNLIFVKKFAKQIELQTEIFINQKFVDMKNWNKNNNYFTGLYKKTPVGIHLLTLQLDFNTILLRLENYIEKNDVIKSVRTIQLQNMFSNFKIVKINELTLAGNMYIDNYVKIYWSKFNESRFVPNLVEKVNLNKIKLRAQEIRTFLVWFELYN